MAKMSNSEKHSRPEVTGDHRRQWRHCMYVYPVISRRSKGLSIGVNLNPDKACNFSCVYCQIDRSTSRGLHDVHIEMLHDELHLALEEAVSGRLWAEPRFSATPKELRRINDIAFSGDGEPTCLKDFDKAVATAARARLDCGCKDVKLVVITNATQLQSEQFKRALPILDASNGEIWAKLDAGTEEAFQRIHRPQPGITLRRIIENIGFVAAEMPVIIQTLFFRHDGKAPAPAEISAYCNRLQEILRAGRIKLIQIHTIARSPAESNVSYLPDAELDTIAETVRSAVGDVPVEVYYGSDVPPQRRKAGK